MRIRLPLILFLGLSLVTGSLAWSQLYLPYYGKNRVKYDHFDWKVYKTEHFDIYYYPREAFALSMIAGIAEDAYRELKDLLQTDVNFRIPLIFFRNQAEFEQANYVNISEGILGVAEPAYNRMAFTIDLPPDLLQDVIVHELTHIFEFSMLFGRLVSILSIQAPPPQWVMEGFASYTTRRWMPTQRMVVRDAVLTERVPYISATRGLIAPPGLNIARTPYNIGQAVFDFIEARFGRAGVRQLWFQLRKRTYLGGFDPFLATFGMSEERFNEAFVEYYEKVFAQYKDYETPEEYERITTLPFPYRQIVSYAISPNGQYIAVMTGNIYDSDLDIVLLDRRGRIIKNLTKGQSIEFIYLTFDRYDFAGRNIAWSPDNEHIAFFGRTKKYRSLFIYNRNGKRVDEIYINLDKAAAPQYHPDGQHISFVAFGDDGQPDIYILDLKTRKVTRLTHDEIYEEAPVWVDGGRALIYAGQALNHSQIYRASYPDGNVEVFFETPKEWYVLTPDLSDDGRYLVFSATVEDPIDIVRVDLKTREMVRMTRVMSGNFSDDIRLDEDSGYVYFISFFKGLYHLYRIPLDRAVAPLQVPSHMVAKVQVPSYSELPHAEINPDLVQDKGFKPVLASRPYIFSGATSQFFAISGGVSLQDILGDQTLTLFFQRIAGFNTYYVSWLDLSRRFQYIAEAYWNDDFFFAPVNELFFGLVKNRQIGGNIFGHYPIDFWRRFELGVGLFRIEQKFDSPQAQAFYEDFLNRTGAEDFLTNGWILPVSVAYTFETTRYFSFGPLSGFTGRIGINYALPLTDSFISRWIVSVDLRQYIRTSFFSLIAWRVQAYQSDGDVPALFFFGGGQNFRGFDFRELWGNQVLIGTIEYRFPLLPWGLRREHPWLNILRGKLFMDAGVFRLTAFGDNFPFLISEEGFNPSDGVGSFGVGLTVFFGGLPINLEMAWIHNFHRVSRSPRLNFSIGYDF